MLQKFSLEVILARCQKKYQKKYGCLPEAQWAVTRTDRVTE
jgi:hypothetical protein